MAPNGSPQTRTPAGHNYGAPARRTSTSTVKTADPNLFVIDVAGPREKLPRPPSSLAPENVYADTSKLKKEAAKHAAQKPDDANVVEAPDEDPPSKQASPAFLWPTCESVLMRSHKVVSPNPFPFAAICAPFSDGADSRSLELATPAGGVEGALRCPSCGCYANPYFRWCEKEAGPQNKVVSSFQCNMCRCQFDVPDGYLQGFDKPDPDHHPELFFGSVDIAAPGRISVGTASALTEPATVFVLEQSKEAMEGGLHRAALAAVERAMDHPESQFRKRICLITYCDDLVHFHSLNQKTGRFRRIIVRSEDDDDEPFLPEAPASLMVDLRDDLFRDDFRELLQVMQLEAAEAEDQAEDSEDVSTASSSPSSSRSRSTSSGSCRRESMRLQSRSICAVAGDALKLAVEVLEGVGGGDVMMFHATPPVPSRKVELLPSSKPALSATSQNGWWRGAAWQRVPSPAKNAEAISTPTQQASQNEDLLGRCIRAGVAVSVVTAPSAEMVEYMDVDSLQWLAWRTGGDALHMPNFRPGRSEKQLCDYLHHWGGRMMGSAYNCVVRLRCSKGISCQKLLAPWSAAVGSADQSTFELPRVAADTSFAYELAVEREPENEDELPLRLNYKKVFYIQLATLYTDITGRRMLRVHTTVIGTVPNVRSMFQSASVGPMMTYVVKQAAATALEEKPGSRLQSRDCMLDFLLKILVAYRRLCCCRDVSESKVIAIDRRLKLLPLYVLGARKLIFSATWNGPSGNEHLRTLLRMPVHSILAAIYPRIYALEDHSVAELPWPLAPAQECILHGSAPAYVITNGLGAWTYRRRDSQPRNGIEDGSLDVDARRKIGTRANEICEKLKEVLEPAPRPLALTEIKSLSVATELVEPKQARQTRESIETKRISGCAADATTISASGLRQARAFLSALFVEDEGYAEMSYVGWLDYLHEQVRNLLA
eukprot:TRINITY_DN14035_c0_g1_i4.p1 TRINITY_DN14035_c0_g1~~TRINITY_DN14035_c0_g1_i4.p1  ORF type:complete len:956 (+),score=168.67 TRINITY_DN14035_c0_g1_i4:46-2868(+)